MSAANRFSVERFVGANLDDRHPVLLSRCVVRGPATSPAATVPVWFRESYAEKLTAEDWHLVRSSMRWKGLLMHPFDIDLVLAKVSGAVEEYPKAAMFELAERGFSTPFQQLVACMISIRTRDEESLPISERLFKQAPTPEAIAALSTEEISTIIRPSTFYERKAVQIHALAERVRDEFAGDLPCVEETLRSFAGVGIKCANLALGIACGQPVISVDIHVHRVCNRWGYVSTTTPERTHDALMRILPERHRVEINAVLVPFGKHICTGVAPKCSTCPVEAWCRKVGVTSHR